MQLFLPLHCFLQLFPLFHLSRLIYSTPPSAVTSCIPFFSIPSLYLSSCSSHLSHHWNNKCDHKTCWCHLCWCSIFSNKKAQVLDKFPSFTVETKIALLILLSILLLLYWSCTILQLLCLLYSSVTHHPLNKIYKYIKYA